MMTEISLNILDVAENSVRAGASLVEIAVDADLEQNRLTVMIKDNGCGMSPEQLEQVTDPFFTTRTTRKVGLGIPFFKMAALSADGDFEIVSKEGEGTEVKAEFALNHIDRMPLGDINGTIYTLVNFHPDMDFCYVYRYDGKEFVLDTRQMRDILGDIPLDTPEVTGYIREYLEENNIPGIYGLDTRRLTRSIRDKGSRKVIITDINMPKMDGFEFIETLRNDEMYMDIPVIVMSSLSKETALKRIGKLKIDGYMQKDLFNQTEFIEKIKETLTKYHA